MRLRQSYSSIRNYWAERFLQDLICLLNSTLKPTSHPVHEKMRRNCNYYAHDINNRDRTEKVHVERTDRGNYGAHVATSVKAGHDMHRNDE